MLRLGTLIKQILLPSMKPCIICYAFDFSNIVIIIILATGHTLRSHQSPLQSSSSPLAISSAVYMADYFLLQPSGHISLSSLSDVETTDWPHHQCPLFQYSR